MAKSKMARQITLGRQFSELDFLLSQLSSALKTAESIKARGVDADVELMMVTEALRSARATVRHAIDETGSLIDAEAEGSE